MVKVLLHNKTKNEIIKLNPGEKTKLGRGVFGVFLTKIPKNICYQMYPFSVL